MTLGTFGSTGFAPRLAGLYVAIFAASGILLPFFPLWLKSRGLDAQMIGIVLSAPMIVRVGAVTWVTRRADRRDSLRVLLIACACATTAGYMLVGMAEGPVLILLAVVLTSAAYTPIMPLTDSYALRGLAALGRAYGPVRLWGSAAFIGGGFLGGFAADLISARDLIWLIVVAYAVAALAAFSLAPLPPFPHAAHRTAPHENLLRNGSFLAVLAAASLIQASHAVFYSFSAVAWSAAGLDGVAIAGLWALGVVAEMVLFAMSGRLPSWLTPTRLLMAGALGAVLRWTAMAFDPPSAALPWLQLLHALSFGATHLGALGFIACHARPGQGATAQGYLYIAIGLATAGATGLSGLLYASFGGRAYAAMALAAAAGGACALIAQRLGRRDAVM